jgi:hypothetical protein
MQLLGAGRRRKKLEELNKWRNAIAHQDFSKIGGDPALTLRTVQLWRAACAGLARTLDALVAKRVLLVVGKQPW